ncbi:hypothetical protein GGS24DRAFT_159719 [Hypoxylon argillaceum]|nr:hypothetical protein GGS24DRAFT_159719 [Hypoxylon argillaceum]
MYFSTIFGLFLAALVTAAPSSSHSGQGTIVTQKRGLVTFVMTEPDCPSLKSYCTTCNDDFNCETDPRCEWCYEHDKFN